MDNNRMTMDNELRIVQGNTFATAIEIHAVDATGQPIVDWSLQDSTDLRVWYVFAGREQDITTWQISDGKLVILWLANMQRVGTYDILCAGKYNGADWRNAMQYQFRIVRFNHEANIPSNVIILDGIYQLSAEMAIITRMFDNRGTPSNTTPNMDGEAEVGTEERYARGDHRHPSDTSKQDVIDDLTAIRSGAAAGASAYQKPSTGIPKTDMAQDVQQSLGKADTALQPSDIVDSLNSGSTTAPLSANQGKILNETKQDNLTFDSAPTSGSDNPVKSGGVYDAIGEVDAKFDDYAKIDGAYEGMLAGNAMNLVDTTGTPILRDFVFSKSGGSEQIATGTALIKRLRGNTIVWNQLVQNGNFVDETGWNCPGTSSNSVSSNTLSFTASAYRGRSIQRMYTITNAHKYYCSAKIKLTTGTTNVRFGLIVNAESQWAGYQFTGNNTNWQNLGFICTANLTEGSNLIMVRDERTDSWDEIQVKDVMCIDLTQMFGAGNEPTTVAEFEKMFPLPYYAYDAGSLLSFSGDSVKTVGFNQWDEEWEVGSYSYVDGSKMVFDSAIRSKNPIHVFPNAVYYYNNIENLQISAFYYDVSGNFISSGGVRRGNTFTTPSNCYYINFRLLTTSYNNGICINLSDPSKNGTYEPYVVNTKDISFYKRIRDGGGNLLFPESSMASDGTVYDEVTATKATKRIGRQLVTGSIGDTITLVGCSTTATTYKCASEIGTLSSGVLTLTAAVTDAEVLFELATPIEVEFEEQNMAYPVDGGGTEQLLPENTSTPTTTPARIDVNYGLDAMATLKNLQKNYLAQTDLDRMLTAMGTALGFTYTKTWDATNNQWNFTITANS